MTVAAPADPAIPERPDPEHLAVGRRSPWLREDQAAAEEHEEAMRADSYQHEMRRRMDAADRARGAARARLSGLIDKHNLDGRKTLAFWPGSAIVTALVVLDAIPLNWAAQAFDLDERRQLAGNTHPAGGVHRGDGRAGRGPPGLPPLCYPRSGHRLCRSGRAPYFFPDHGGRRRYRRRPAAGCRAQRDLAGLVFLGSAVMARTRSLGLPGPWPPRAARAAHQPGERAAWRRADEKLERHLGVLHRQLVRQPLYAAVLSGLTHAEWVAALERALRAQFTPR